MAGLRKPDPTHGRRILITLTESGIEKLNKCNEVVLKVEEKCLKALILTWLI